MSNEIPEVCTLFIHHSEETGIYDEIYGECYRFYDDYFEAKETTSWVEMQEE